jgi:hypothetical protein
MPIAIQDPRDELRNRAREMATADPYALPMDEKETAEREEAAQAYFGENEKHYVDYCQACVKESNDASDDIRKAQDECWRAYNELEPKSYQNKEFWQSRIVVPKPFQTVQFGAASVKKAFSPNYLSISKSLDKLTGSFWQKVLDDLFSVDKGKFVSRFGDANIMGFAVGQTMEIIPRWLPGRGLHFSLVEPWKIHRDPDAMSREPQSGMYWIHEEWLDYHVLLDGQKRGRYFDVARAKNVSDSGGIDDPLMTKEAIAERRKMVVSRSPYRAMILTREFWGMVLDPKGNILLPSATFTVAGGRVIQLPTAVTTRRRWPGTSFSPLPNLLRFGGRGLLEGVVRLWDAINEIMCLHMDALKWVTSPSKEINVDALLDPEDVDDTPGKRWLTRDTANGQQVLREHERRGRTNEILANQQYLDQNFQRGAFVTDAVQGLPGYRKDMTFREASMNLDQAMGVFGLMGESLEEGAVDITDLSIDVIFNNIGYADLKEIFSEEELKLYGIQANPNASRGVVGVPEFSGRCHISGMQSLMRDAEALKTLREVVIPMAESPRFGKYIKPYGVIKAIESRVNLTDEGIFVGDEESKIVDLQERLAAAREGDALEKLARLKEVLGITDIIERLQKIDAEDIRQAAEEIRLMSGQIGMEKTDDGTGNGGGPANVAPQSDTAPGSYPVQAG